MLHGLPAALQRPFLVCLALSLTLLGRAQEPPPRPPIFSFGVIADVQYAQKKTVGARHYASSLGRLERAVETLNREELAFTVHLGDFVDGGLDNLERLSAALHELGARIRTPGASTTGASGRRRRATSSRRTARPTTSRCWGPSASEASCSRRT